MQRCIFCPDHHEPLFPRLAACSAHRRFNWPCKCRIKLSAKPRTPPCGSSRWRVPGRDRLVLLVSPKSMPVIASFEDYYGWLKPLCPFKSRPVDDDLHSSARRASGDRRLVRRLRPPRRSSIRLTRPSARRSSPATARRSPRLLRAARRRQGAAALSAAVHRREAVTRAMAAQVLPCLKDRRSIWRKAAA